MMNKSPCIDTKGSAILRGGVYYGYNCIKELVKSLL